LIDFFINKNLSDEEIKIQINSLSKQMGRNTMLKSNYLYLCMRKRKIKQIQEKIIK
jgi:hypothetical protein